MIFSKRKRFAIDVGFVFDNFALQFLAYVKGFEVCFGFPMNGNNGSLRVHCITYFCQSLFCRVP